VPTQAKPQGRLACAIPLEKAVESPLEPGGKNDFLDDCAEQRSIDLLCELAME
jgi:hypothetical protein